MKYILLLVIFMAGCIPAISSEDARIHTIRESNLTDYKYRVFILDTAGNNVIYYTNSECKIGQTIRECERQ